MKKYFEFNKPFLKFLPLFFIILTLLILLGNSRSLVSNIVPKQEGYIEKTNNLKILFLNNNDNIFNLENKEISFKIKNMSSKKITYNVYLEFKDNNNKIKYKVIKNNKDYLENIIGNDNYIDKFNVIKSYETISYNVKVNTDIKDKYKIIIEES